ncbi:MAG: Gfo/Idh/MocA family oxidoreductase [Pirellulales bacterium]
MSHSHRRDFLEEMMIASAATLMAASLPRMVEASGTPNRSANETLRHAVLGCGIRGKVHAQEFSPKLGMEIGYVCDPDLQRAEELATIVEKQHGKRPQVVQDLRKALDDKTIDTISVATPNHWHALAAIWAMQAGKDVYVEKPVSHNVVEGRKMVETAERLHRVCQGGTQNRSRGDLAAAAEYVRAGKLGAIQLARSVIYGKRDSIGPRGQYPIPDGVDYDLFLGPAAMEPLSRPKLHYDWHWQWNTGNGELGNNNIHMIDMCRMLLGLQGCGKSVISLGGRFGYEDAGETPNTQLVIHEFENVTVIQETRGLKSNPFNKDAKDGAILYGSEGMLIGSVLFDLQGKIQKKFEGTSVNHFSNFIEAVRERKPSLLKAPIQEGHASTALCHLGNISYRTGKASSPEEIGSKLKTLTQGNDITATWDRLLEHLRENGIDLSKQTLTLGTHLRLKPGTEEFVAHDEANAMLTRNNRSPYSMI